MAQAEIEVRERDVLQAIVGPGDSHLRSLAQVLGVTLGARGHVLRVQGNPEGVDYGRRVLLEFCDVLGRGAQLTEAEMVQAAQMLRQHPGATLRDIYEDVVLITSPRKQVAPKGVSQQLYVQAIRDRDVVFGVGPAGTGKTYLAMAMAVQALQQKRVQRILITRPAVEAGEKLGFLPGGLEQKVDPYLRPLYDALHDMMDVSRVQALMEHGTIEVAPLAFMRGRTLHQSFVVLDEAQNTTVQQMKMFLTRLGPGSKAVVTGDVTQTDLPRGQRSGLQDAVQVLGGVEGIRVCRFSETDVVRHPLVQRIVMAYEAVENPPVGEFAHGSVGGRVDVGSGTPMEDGVPT